MLEIIKQNQAGLTQLCQRYGVRRLELFGSAARGDFDSTRSDLDFFVEFLAYDTPTIADQWFGLQESLEALFCRKVDLTSLRTATNPYFLSVANRHKLTLYAA